MTALPSPRNEAPTATATNLLGTGAMVRRLHVVAGLAALGTPLHAGARPIVSPDDPALADNAGRVKRTEELDRIIGEWTAKHSLDEVLAVLEPAQVPSGNIDVKASGW